MKKVTGKRRVQVIGIMSEYAEKLEAVIPPEPGQFLHLGWMLFEAGKRLDSGRIVIAPMPKKAKEGKEAGELLEG